ncbi:hypothetical protein AAMO2058_000974700 [Amorphochlora amoebiformis]
MEVSSISAHIDNVAKKEKGAPAFLPDLTRQTSEQIVAKWASATKIMPEYKKYHNQIVVADEWMIHTRLRRLMTDLDKYFQGSKESKDKYQQRKFYEEQLKNLIAKAYNCDAKEAAKKRDIAASINIYNTFCSLWSKMVWRRPLLTLAVELYGKYGEADDIMSSFGTTCYLAQNCITAKRIAFNFILAAAHRSTMEAEAKENGKKTTKKEAKIDGSKMTYPEARERIYEMMEIYLDQHKEYAIKSSVLEPTKYCYEKMGQTHNRDSNDVHGYNYPAAILLSALHVQLPMIPMMGDTWPDQGFLDVWDVKGDIDKLWDLFKKPINFGRAYTGMRKDLEKLKLKGFPKSGTFKTIGSAKTPKNIANIAVDPDAKYKDVRKHIGENYIKKFAYFFSKDFFLKKCFEVLNQESLPEYYGFRSVFQRAFDEYKKDRKEIKEEKVLEWLYDEYFIEIQIDRVWELFTFLGVTKDSKRVRIIPKLGTTIQDWCKAAGVSDAKLADKLVEDGYDDLEWMLSKATHKDVVEMCEECTIGKLDQELLLDVWIEWKDQLKEKMQNDEKKGKINKTEKKGIPIPPVAKEPTKKPPSATPVQFKVNMPIKKKRIMKRVKEVAKK